MADQELLVLEVSVGSCVLHVLPVVNAHVVEHEGLVHARSSRQPLPWQVGLDELDDARGKH